MSVFKRGNVFWYDFAVRGTRYRGSTKEKVFSRARQVESTLIAQAREHFTPVGSSHSITLGDYLSIFLFEIKQGTLERKTKLYYEAGCRLLRGTKLEGTVLRNIGTMMVDSVKFPGGPSNANNALRTLRKALSNAAEEGHIQAAPKIRLRKEQGRDLVIDSAMEVKLLSKAPQPLKDVLTIMLDMGMRPAEVFRMQWNDVSFEGKTVFVPFGKTKAARRWIPMTARVQELLAHRKTKSRWVFPAESKSGHLVTVQKAFEQLRRDTGVPREIVIYSARHTLATDLMDRVSLAKVMKVMGHADVRTTMKYQHPDISEVGEAMDARNAERAERHKPRHSDYAIQ